MLKKNVLFFIIVLPIIFNGYQSGVVYPNAVSLHCLRPMAQIRSKSPITLMRAAEIRSFGSNASFGTGSGLRRIIADGMVRFWPMTIAKHGSRYSPRRPYEDVLAEDLEGWAADIIRDAASLLEQRGGIYRARAERFNYETTVIVLDMPIHLIACGEAGDGPYAQLTHLGFGRGVIYISKKALLDLKNRGPKGLGMLATAINHDQLEFNIFYSPENMDCMKTQKGRQQTIDLAHNKALKDDPFEKMAELEELMNEWREKEPAPVETIKTELDKEKQRFLDLCDKALKPYEGDSNEHVKLCYEAACAALRIAYGSEELGEKGAAEDYLKQASIFFSQVELEETLPLPLHIARRLMCIYASQGRYDLVRDEFMFLMSSKIGGRALRAEEVRIFQACMQSVFYMLNEISYFMIKYAQGQGSPDKEREAFALAADMAVAAQDFLSRTKEQPKGAAVPIQKALSSAATAFSQKILPVFEAAA